MPSLGMDLDMNANEETMAELVKVLAHAYVLYLFPSLLNYRNYPSAFPYSRFIY